MKTITFHTQKGGAGKTTVTGNVAYLLAKSGKKVLIADLDSSQGNILTWTHSENNTRQPKLEIGDYLNAVNSEKEISAKNLKNIVFNVRPNLDILPTFGIGSSLKDYITSKIHQIEELYSFQIMIQESEKLGYDFMFFDLSPAMTTLEQRITFFIDEIILITPASFFGMDGVVINNKENDKLKKIHDKIRKTPLVRNKVILNNFDKRYSEHLKAKEALEKSGLRYWVIRTASAVNNLQSKNLFTSETEDLHPVIEDYLDISKNIIKEA